MKKILNEELIQRFYFFWRETYGFIVDWCSASTIILLSTRQETSLTIFMYMTLSSFMFSTGHESGRFVPCKALYSDKKFSFAFSSSLNRSTKTESLYFLFAVLMVTPSHGLYYSIDYRILKWILADSGI